MSEKQLHITIGAESSEAEMNEVQTIFDTTGLATEINAGYVRASANDLPMIIMVVSQGLVINALWDAIKLTVVKIRSSTVLNSRRRGTQIVIRRKGFKAVIFGNEYQIQTEKENAIFDNIDDFIKYAKAKDEEAETN